MAGDLRRAVHAINACTKSTARAMSAPSRGQARDDIQQSLTQACRDALTQRTTGDQRSIVLDALTEQARILLTQALTERSATLAERTGIPAAAIRSGLGRDQIIGAHDGALPNTPIGRQLAQLDRIQSELDQIDTGNQQHPWAEAWDAAARSGNFDQTIEELLPANDQASELGWALIGFETHKHTNLIWHQANKLVRSFPDRQASDLLGWGWLGLRVALRHYDPTLGFTFSTYACSRIIGSIRDGVRSENPIPKRLNTFTRKVAAAEADLTQKLGRNPSLEEVSDSIGVELSALDILPRTAPQASVNEILDQADERGGHLNWLISPDDPADAALASIESDIVARALDALNPDDAAAVRLLVMEGLNPTEARAVTGASARQLRQRKERALAALRDSLADWHQDASEPTT